nr:MAG TPA: putative Zn-dependent peptidase [Caudoviricetes sp.]
MMLNAQINPEELHKEKEVIIQELKMYQDNPMATVREKRALFFV